LNAARAIFALNSAEYLVLFVLLIFRFPPSLIVYFTPYTTVRIPGSTSSNTIWKGADCSKKCLMIWRP
ncbi:MAG: hypothetical protein Q7U10_06080, partial [Thermodesulfovibrionia bacterium]|nr:hypothetical protein [Thermodesulfovibrionia bacterium]